MSLFGSLRGRFHRKSDDIDELRSGVLNEPFQQEPLGSSPFSRDVREARDATRPMFPRAQDDPLMRRDYPSERDYPADAASLEPITRDNVSFESRPQSSGTGEGTYEILDRLKLIENQLSAIRSQTELINERLKNLELKLGRTRY